MSDAELLALCEKEQVFKEAEERGEMIWLRTELEEAAVECVPRLIARAQEAEKEREEYARLWHRDAARAQKAEEGLAAAMYRLDLCDLNFDSGDWPMGVVSNAGECDYQAERLVRAAWVTIPVGRQHEAKQGVQKEVLAALKEQTP